MDIDFVKTKLVGHMSPSTRDNSQESRVKSQKSKAIPDTTEATQHLSISADQQLSSVAGQQF